MYRMITFTPTSLHRDMATLAGLPLKAVQKDVWAILGRSSANTVELTGPVSLDSSMNTWAGTTEKECCKGRAGVAQAKERRWKYNIHWRVWLHQSNTECRKKEHSPMSSPRLSPGHVLLLLALLTALALVCPNNYIQFIIMAKSRASKNK